MEAITPPPGAARAAGASGSVTSSAARRYRPAVIIAYTRDADANVSTHWDYKPREAVDTVNRGPAAVDPLGQTRR